MSQGQSRDMSLGVHHPEAGRNTGAVSGDLTFDRGSSRTPRATVQMIAIKAVMLNVTIRPAMRISVFMQPILAARASRS